MLLNADKPLMDDARLITSRMFHGQRETVLLCALLSISACLLIFASTADNVFLFFAATFAVLSFTRFCELIWSERNATKLLQGIKSRSYSICHHVNSVLISAALGGLCYYSIHISQNIFAIITSLAVANASVLPLLMSNNTSSTLLNWRIAIASLPIAVALIQRGTYNSFSLLFFEALYIVGIVWLARVLRANSAKWLQTILRLKAKTQKLNIALNTMPQGVVLFDAAYNVVLINEHAMKLLGMKQHRLVGRNFAVIIRFCVLSGLFSAESYSNVRSRIENLLNGQRKQDILQVAIGRYLECTATLNENGNVALVLDDVTSRVKAEEQIQYMAHYDALTNLPNRVYFDGLIRSVRMNNTQSAWEILIVIDIQQLKRINEAHGHLRGDEALRAFSLKLNELDKSQYIASRFGSDEFVLYVKPSVLKSDVTGILTHVLQTVIGVYAVGNMNLEVDVRAGVIVSSEKLSLNEMHMKAGLALVEAKADSDHKWVLYEERMNKTYHKNKRLREDLKKAVAQNVLEVHYQPIVSSRSLRIVAYEALARWKHPELGYVPPSDFIPLAEEIGLVSQITEQVLLQACQDCTLWPEHINVSVNLSVIDLESEKVVLAVQKALNSSQLAVSRLELEVTESAVIRDQDRAVPILERLRRLGVSIALDDFGTGYSSLSYLNVLPLTKVKIDRAFVNQISTNNRSMMLLRGIAHLSRELGLGVTVEGIETEEQLAIIRRSGVADFLQGYLLGRPAAKEQRSNYDDKPRY